MLTKVNELDVAPQKVPTTAEKLANAKKLNELVSQLLLVAKRLKVK